MRDEAVATHAQPRKRKSGPRQVSRAGETLTLQGELFRIDDLYGS